MPQRFSGWFLLVMAKLLSNQTSKTIRIRPADEIAKLQESIAFSTANTASIHDSDLNITYERLPIFLCFICNSGYNLNKKSLALFQAPSPIVVNTIVPRQSQYSISNINSKPLLLATPVFKTFLSSLAHSVMDTSVNDFDQILIQDGNLFKLQLLVSTRSNTCTKQLRVHFQELIQIETNKL